MKIINLPVFLTLFLLGSISSVLAMDINNNMDFPLDKEGHNIHPRNYKITGKKIKNLIKDLEQIRAQRHEPPLTDNTTYFSLSGVWVTNLKDYNKLLDDSTYLMEKSTNLSGEDPLTSAWIAKGLVPGTNKQFIFTIDQDYTPN